MSGTVRFADGRYGSYVIYRQESETSPNYGSYYYYYCYRQLGKNPRMIRVMIHQTDTRRNYWQEVDLVTE